MKRKICGRRKKKKNVTEKGKKRGGTYSDCLRETHRRKRRCTLWRHKKRSSRWGRSLSLCSIMTEIYTVEIRVVQRWDRRRERGGHLLLVAFLAHADSGEEGAQQGHVLARIKNPSGIREHVVSVTFSISSVRRAFDSFVLLSSCCERKYR